jgi:hypothetical protein
MLHLLLGHKITHHATGYVEKGFDVFYFPHLPSTRLLRAPPLLALTVGDLLRERGPPAAARFDGRGRAPLHRSLAGCGELRRPRVSHVDCSELRRARASLAAGDL